MIEPDRPRLSIVRQCQLVNIARSSHYYEGRGETPLNLALKRLMGMTAIYRKPKTSTPNPAHKIYPYLLRDL